MNAKKAKLLRMIIPPTDEASRRVYRRAKKQYSRTPHNLREGFLFGLAKIFSKSDES